jgi:hypothetical protein
VYYASMLRYWHLVWILVRTDHPCLGVGCHNEDEKANDEDEVALFIKKFITKGRPYKGDRREKSRSKRVCYNCCKNGYFIAQCPYERKEEGNEKKRSLTKATRKTRGSQRRSPMVKLMLVMNGTQVMRVSS